MRDRVKMGGMSNAGSDLLDTKEVAARADVVPATVTRWVAENRIEPVYKGTGLRGFYLFTRDEVERFLRVREAELSLNNPD